MTSALRATCWLIFALLTASVLHAQNAGTTAVFPQVVDGVSIDGSVFTSQFRITSVAGFPAACSISLFGIGAERLTASASFVVQPSSSQAISTRGQDVIAFGYARLDCSQPVFASLTYRRSLNGVPLGIATVPGAPLVSRALIPMTLDGSFRYGIAIANDKDSLLEVSLSFTSAATTVLRSLEIPPRSHYVVFVDEIFSVPEAGSGAFEILANGSVGSGEFNIMALLFDGELFTNVVPAVLP
jgi:hypothetical protein